MLIESQGYDPYAAYYSNQSNNGSLRIDDSNGSLQAAGDSGNSGKSGASGNGDELTEEERAIVRQLQARDTEVRQHEEAHAAAAGHLAQGGPQYEYTTGPDDKQYAIGGHVNISLREGSSPEESISLAQQAQRAALAPAQPSSQDYKVAAQAAAMEAEARAELNEEQKNGNYAVWAPQPPKESVANAYGQPSSTPPGSVLYEFG